MAPAPRLVLASASPARLTLLRGAGFDPEPIPSGVDEDGVGHLPPAEAARTLAERKARAVAGKLAEPAIVVGCDSLLAIDGRIRGKPASADEARSWWRSQRGTTGTLFTGQCVIAGEGEISDVAATEVRFGSPSDEEIDAYIATGEPLQVAGAATIDGYGAPFVDWIEGDHGTVLGLSLPLLRRMLADLGIPITRLWRRPPA